MTEPRATYRLQLAGDFGFAAARELVPYLRDLGVSHLYLPPSFQARAGSAHGYDVVDPNAISAERGGETEFRALVDAVREAGMGIVLDIVPNHMAVDDANRYWSDRELRTKFFDIDERTGRHRRFFDIDHLAGVRQEDPEVFAATHELTLRLVREGAVDGLRIDHPDGLADPAGYLARLNEAKYVWVEKILDPGERLREWPVSGTTGYEFLNDVAALYVDPAGEAPLTDLWEEVSGDHRRFREHAFEAKLEQARTAFAPEVDRLRREAPRPLTGLERALASLPVYRTYVEPWSGRVEDADRAAVAVAGLPQSLARVLTLEDGGWDAFVTRFQQTTPPVMAKGVEDTAFYRYLRLLALNDVGGDPARFSLRVERFHAANRERAERFPLNLLATQTHDTKRSGDVRARLGALASMPDRWVSLVRRWLATSRVLTTGGAPDSVEQYLIFQTIAAAWPIEPERLIAYMEKALREAKRNTSWIEPNEQHEAAVRRFVRALYDHRDFRRDFDGFAADLAEEGDRAALGQLLLKLTSPGVPDIYQGDELLSLSLVDPDNRRPVEWAARREALTEVLAGAAVPRKLFVIQRALALRARRPDAFTGDYAPLEAGPDAIAFARGGEVIAAARLRGDGARTVSLPDGNWRDVLGDRSLSGRVSVEDLTGELGIALLERG
jgi:(1->4)-alpha-D-glucan 1-alpha-D-glucosylmutase